MCSWTLETFRHGSNLQGFFFKLKVNLSIIFLLNHFVKENSNCPLLHSQSKVTAANHYGLEMVGLAQYKNVKWVKNFMLGSEGNKRKSIF